MIPIFLSQKELSLAQLQTLPEASLSKLFDGRPCLTPFNYRVALDSEHLIISVQYSGAIVRFEQGNNGEYREHLAERDVFEVWITDSALNSYFEVHLAPGGSWWACIFSTPRIRINQTLSALLSNAHSTLQTKSWETTIYLKKALVPLLATPLKELRFNVTACSGINPRNYLSDVVLNGAKPNFHQPACFSSPVILDLF